jgi:hypothetical protein
MKITGRWRRLLIKSETYYRKDCHLDSPSVQLFNS